MKLFLIYIFLTVIAIYLDYKYYLNGTLLILFFIVTILFFVKTKKYKKNNIRFDNTIIYVLMFSISFFTLYNVISNLIFQDFSRIDTIKKFNIFDVLKALLIYPILEELVFRKYFLTYLPRLYSPKKAILILSIGFAICHFLSDSGVLFVFFNSVFLSYTFIKTKNLLLCAVAHILNNYLALYFLPIIATFMNYNLSKICTISVITLTISIISLSLIKIKNIKYEF